MNKLFIVALALPGVIALILVLMLWQRQGLWSQLEVPRRETTSTMPNVFTAVQQERLTVFINWVDETDAKIRTIGSGSDYAHDFKIQRLAVTKDNYVCGTVWLRPRNSSSSEQVLRYVLPPGDRIVPINVHDNKYWNEAGCDTATLAVLHSDVK